MGYADWIKMKINEIIMEAPPLVSKLGGLAKTGFSKAKNLVAPSEGQKQLNNVANVFIGRWNNLISQDPSNNTPENLQQFLKQATPRAPGIISKVATPASMKSSDVNNYIRTVLGKYLSYTAINSTGMSDPTRTKSSSPQQKPKYKMVNGQLVQVPEQPAPQQPTPAPTPAGPQLATGVEIKNNEPIIISTGRGKDFGLNDQGQWVHLASGKVPTEAMQAFLSQQHNLHLGT